MTHDYNFVLNCKHCTTQGNWSKMMMIYVDDVAYEVVVYSVERHAPCHAMESSADLGGVAIDYEVRDLDGNKVTLGYEGIQCIESELQEIYA